MVWPARHFFLANSTRTDVHMYACAHIHTHTHTVSLTHSSTKVRLFLDIVIEASFKFALWKLLTELYMFLSGLIVSHIGVRRVKLKIESCVYSTSSCLMKFKLCMVITCCTSLHIIIMPFSNILFMSSR